MTVQPTRAAGAGVERFDPEQSRFPVLFAGTEDGGSFQEIVTENLGDEGFSAFDLPRIKIPAQGNVYWNVPDGPPVATLEGIVALWGTTRTFWRKAMGSGETTPPDCASTDGKVGLGEFKAGSQANPSGLCANCPMNEWGSMGTLRGTDSKGRACREQRQVWLLEPEAMLPYQVTLPPSSLKAWKGYMVSLLTSKPPKRYYEVVSRLGLKAEQMGGNKVAVVVPEKAGDLAAPEKAAAAQYSAMIQGFVRQVTDAAVADGDLADVARMAGSEEPDAPSMDPFADEPDIPDEYR